MIVAVSHILYISIILNNFSDQDASPKTSKRYTPSPEVYGRKVPKKEVEDDSYSSLPCSSSTSNYNALSSYKEQKPLGNFKIVKVSFFIWVNLVYFYFQITYNSFQKQFIFRKKKTLSLVC